MIDAKLFDETARLAALRRYQIMDTPPEAPFDKITALVRTVLDVPMSAVTLLDDSRQWLKSRQGINATETSRAISFCTHTIQTHQPMVIPDARIDQRFMDNPLVQGDPHIVSYAGVPLASPDGYNIGALCAIDVVPRTFRKPEIEILRNFGALVVDELELRQIAQRDYLTGALTRRGFVAEAEKEIARRDRYWRPSALMMLDIDHFKAVNDEHGHPVGDEVLKAVARCCEDAMRPSDSCGRVGGEEFALLLPETDPAEAAMAANRFRQKIEALKIDIGKCEPLKVTASFGVAPLTSDVHFPDEWLARADIPLYAAKKGGRNRIASYGAVEADIKSGTLVL